MADSSRKQKQFRIKPVSRAVIIACGATGLALSPIASAQDVLALEEIIVTAQKRDQSLQDVPVSIGVLGAMQLEDNGVGDLEDIAHLMPAMSYVSLGPGSGNVYMRGISSGGESAIGSNPNVAVYMDEQPVTAVGAFLSPHIYDIERIETLAGPQGTLFGANAQAGSLRIITKKPEPGIFSSGFDVEVNSVEHGETGSLVEGFVNIPMGDRAAVRLVGYRKDDAGYVDNVAGSHTYDYQYIRDRLTDPADIALAQDITITNDSLVEEDYNKATTVGARAAVRFDIDDNWTVTAGIMRQELDTHGVWDHDPSEVGDLQVVRYLPDNSADEWNQVSLVVEGQIGEMTLTYAGADLNRRAQFESDYSLYADATLSPGYTSTYYSCYVAYFGACEDPRILYTGDSTYDRTNHEIRLVSNQENRFRWLAGVFYEDGVNHFDAEWHVLGLPGLTGNGSFGGGFDGNPVAAALEAPDIYWTTDQVRSNEEIAYFGEVSFDITDSWGVSYSARYFDFDSSLVGFSGTFWWPSPQFGARGTGGPNPNTDLFTNHSDSVGKFTVTYGASDNAMMYASYSEGYRPGGLNRIYNSNIGAVYAPDFLDSYEFGIKSTLMDGRMRFNAAVFTQSWDNFQLSKIDTSVSVLTLTDNVGKADSDGFEFDGTFLVNDAWSLNFGLSYIDATLSESYWLRAADEGVTPPQAPAGTELPRVPDLKWNVASRYNFELMGRSAFVQGNYSFTGDSYNLLYGTSVTRDRDKQKSYNILDLAFGVEMEQWSGELFVKNLTDERGQVFINGASYDTRIMTNRPRTLGLRFKMGFE